MFVAVVFVPLAIVLTNALERRASYRLLFQQEYASVASTCLYALAVASLTALLIVIVFHVTGADISFGRMLLGAVQEQIQVQPQMQSLFDQRLMNAGSLFAGVAFLEPGGELEAVGRNDAVVMIRRRHQGAWELHARFQIVVRRIGLQGFELFRHVGRTVATVDNRRVLNGQRQEAAAISSWGTSSHSSSSR